MHRAMGLINSKLPTILSNNNCWLSETYSCFNWMRATTTMADLRHVSWISSQMAVSLSMSNTHSKSCSWQFIEEIKNKKRSQLNEKIAKSGPCKMTALSWPLKRVWCKINGWLSAIKWLEWFYDYCDDATTTGVTSIVAIYSRIAWLLDECQ